MSKNLDPIINFYIPSPRLVHSVPDEIEKYWQWIHDAIQQAPAILPRKNQKCFWVGPYNWTIQSFLYLKKLHFPCALSSSLPKQGIIISHSDMLPPFLKPTREQYIVEIKPDRSLSCIYANYVIVQNRHDPIRKSFARFVIPSAFVNYWPQPGLIPRNPTRGNRFENIRYFGNPEQFIGSTDDLEIQVKRLGLNWKMVPHKDWHDYSQVDAIVAVRPPEYSNRKGKKISPSYSTYLKPATKLYNAWLAGVPAILSPDPAFQDLRQSRLDFLEARDIPQIIAALERLRGDPLLRRSMKKNGSVRGEAFEPDKICREWVRVLESEIIPRYNVWTQSQYRRKWLFFTRKHNRKLLNRHTST